MALTLDPDRTALVVIDLQRGIVARPTVPYSAAQVVERAARLADACRRRRATVVLVRVAYHPDGRDLLRPLADEAAPAGPPPDPDWATIVPELGPREGDVVVTKHQWGAFYGTDLDPELRRRRVDTIVLAGIATNIGVESTARAAYEHGYQQVLVEDAMAALTEAGHRYPVTTIFPRIGRVRSTAEVLQALDA